MGIPRTPEPEVMDSAAEAVDYDSMDHSRVNRIFVSDFLEFLQRHHNPSDSVNLSIVDLGTGTARIPLQLLESWPSCGTVWACDLSLEMLKLARRNIRDAGMERRIVPVFTDAKRLPMADAGIDVVISNSIIHHIPGPETVFAEIRRCLRPGGVLFLRDLLRPSSVDELEHLVTTYAGAENAHQQQMFRDSLHAALTLDEICGLMVDVGFPADAVRQNSDRHWTAACRG